MNHDGRTVLFDLPNGWTGQSVSGVPTRGLFRMGDSKEGEKKTEAMKWPPVSPQGEKRRGADSRGS